MALISICQIIFSISVLGALFIFFRNLPLLVEFEPEPIPKEKKLYFRLKKRFSVIKENLGKRFHQLRERNLRRLRVLTLKIDNFLSSYLKRTRETKLHKEKNHFLRKKKEKSKSESQESVKR